MTPVGLCFTVATLLALAAGREVLVARAIRRGVGAEPGRSETPLHGPWARVALALDLPERLRRSGLEARLPLPALLLGKFAGAVFGAILALGAAPAAPGRIGIAVALGLPAAGFFVPDALLER